MTDKSLIFIISLPRSGSTFLQNLLSNNKQVNTCSEPWILLNYAQHLNPKLVKATYNSRHASTAFQYYLKNHPDLDHKQLLRNHILSLYQPLKLGSELVIDKTPRYWEIAEEIAELFPEARIIVLKRNPLDVLRSMIKTYDFKKMEQLVQFSRDLMVGPHKLNDFCNGHKADPQVKILRYEDLKADTPNLTKDLYQWLDIPYDPAVLDLDQNTKYKGEYGDPYQNPESDESSGLSMNKGELSKMFKNLVQGYGAYLGADFLKDYGSYNDSLPGKINTAFRYFRFLTVNGSQTVSQRFKNALKSVFYQFRFGKN